MEEGGKALNTELGFLPSRPSTWVATQTFIPSSLASPTLPWAHPRSVQESPVNNKQLKGRK